MATVAGFGPLVAFTCHYGPEGFALALMLASLLLASRGQGWTSGLDGTPGLTPGKDVRQSVTFRMPNDVQGAIVNGKFGTKLFPETWIIDADGIIRLRFDGALDWSDPVALDLIRAYR